MFKVSASEFSSLPSQAVLSTILPDEYSTSVVRTEEGDKAGSNQQPAHYLVHLKLKAMPN